MKFSLWLSYPLKKLLIKKNPEHIWGQMWTLHSNFIISEYNSIHHRLIWAKSTKWIYFSRAFDRSGEMEYNCYYYFLLKCPQYILFVDDAATNRLFINTATVHFLFDGQQTIDVAGFLLCRPKNAGNVLMMLSPPAFDEIENTRAWLPDLLNFSTIFCRCESGVVSSNR